MPITTSDTLIYFALEYQGNFKDIYNTLLCHERVDPYFDIKKINIINI